MLSWSELLTWSALISKVLLLPYCLSNLSHYWKAWLIAILQVRIILKLHIFLSIYWQPSFGGLIWRKYLDLSHLKQQSISSNPLNTNLSDVYIFGCAQYWKIIMFNTTLHYFNLHDACRVSFSKLRIEYAPWVFWRSVCV